MAHTEDESRRLLNRTRRIRGQIDAVMHLLEQDADCSDTLHAIAVCRGALDSLMAEVINGHIRYHILDQKRKPTAEQTRAAEDLIDALKMYLK